MEAYVTLVLTNKWLYIISTYRFIIFKKFTVISTISHALFFFCSEEELPYHNAAVERVSPALCSFNVTDDYFYPKKKLPPL